MRLHGDAWDARFRDFQHEAFRLETLPEYRVPQERDTYAAFLAGAAPPPPHRPNAWTETVRAATARGARVRRVHIVTSPLSDYLRFEMTWYYPANQAAGEQIRILDLAATADPGLPGTDYWMFDERDVVLMRYAPDGTQLGRDLLEDPDLADYRHWRDLAWDAAVPLEHYHGDAAAPA